jgi:hypothetical protein
MEIIGKHDSGFDNKHDCKISIEKGIIGVYTIGDTKKEELNQPKNDEDWRFEKLNRKESKVVKATENNIFNPNIKPVYSHKIVYKTKHNETQRIFINPTMEEIIEINSQLKKYWILQNDFLKPLILVIIGAILAIATGIIIASLLSNT